MKTQTIAFAIAALVSVRLAGAGTLTGVILYPLTPPSGLTSAESEQNYAPHWAAAGQVVGDGSGTSILIHAVLWTTAGTPVDLNLNAAFGDSTANGTSGNQQVGWSSVNSGINLPLLASLWSGTPASLVLLHPAGYDSSEAFGTNGAQQVGRATTTGGDDHAALWNGTAASFIDLNPAGYTFSDAHGTDGAQQVGSAGIAASGGGSGIPQAMLWSGTAASAVNLNPAGFDISGASDVSGPQQVGGGSGPATGSKNHALLWTGSAASYVDLNPVGFNTSTANGTNGTQQVGYGEETVSGETHALFWSGTAGSFVDLHLLLPSDGTWSYSEASSVDPSGNIFGSAYGTYHGSTGNFAAEWTVPEPVALAPLALCGFMLGARRRSWEPRAFRFRSN